jgi:hypothetical protein
MSLYVGIDFTPVENYETTLDQKWDALSHARSRIPASDVLEVASMLGLVHLITARDTAVPTCRWNHPATPENIGTRRNGKTYCLECGRERHRRARKERTA